MIYNSLSKFNISLYFSLFNFKFSSSFSFLDFFFYKCYTMPAAHTKRVKARLIVRVFFQDLSIFDPLLLSCRAPYCSGPMKITSIFNFMLMGKFGFPFLEILIKNLFSFFLSI